MKTADEIILLIDGMIKAKQRLQRIEMDDEPMYKDYQLINDLEVEITLLTELKQKIQNEKV